MVKYHILSISVGALLIFSNLLPSSMVAAILSGYTIISILLLKIRYNLFYSLLITSIYLIPTSFISILGGGTDEFPIAWFHLLILSLTILSLLKTRISRAYHIYIFLYFSIIGLLCFFQNDIFDALKQFFVILFFLFSFYITEHVRKDKNRESYTTTIYDVYLGSSLAVSLQVIIQKIVVDNLGIILGHSDTYAERVAWGGLMGDYSFTTLYIATGIMLVILYYLEYKRIGLFAFIVLLSFLAYGQVSVTARTGWVALGAGVALYFFVNIKRINHSKLILVIIAFIIAIPYLYEMLLSSRGTDVISSSGRTENYIVAIDYFLDNFFMGIGLGLKNLYQQTREGVPHNFFVQYLLQVGVIGTIIITLPFMYFWKLNIRKQSGIKYIFIVTFFGSMFIPDIVSSRFLYGVLILIAASKKFIII